MEITLKRSGDAPLKFMGELVAEVLGDQDKRWHDLRLYQTKGGSYVAQIEYRSRWQGEIDTSHVEVADNPEAIADFFRSYDPTASVLGYPPTGIQMAEKQQRLLRELRLRYEDQVSEILSIFAEIVE